MLTKTFIVTCPIGLHARPSSTLVGIAEEYKSAIRIKYKEKDVPLNSIIGVMILGAETGDSVEITVEGEDQEVAMKRLEDFFEKELQDL